MCIRDSADMPNLSETLGPAAINDVAASGAAGSSNVVGATPTASGLQPLTRRPRSGIRTSTDMHRNRSIDADVERYGADRTAMHRPKRWTNDDEKVDRNGRFGLNRHVGFAPSLQVRVGK